MANDLKRVGFIFDSEGNERFVKSLGLVNASIRENYQDFKLMQAQWDNSTSSTQKLKDTLVYLNNALDLQEDKVVSLKAELAELENAENRDEVAIKKKRAAITQAETTLQKYKNQIQETNNKLKSGSERLEDFAKKAENVGGKIESAGKKISAFSTASVAAFITSAKSAIEFEDAFTGVEKTVDASEKELAQLKTEIREMAKEIPSTTTEIAQVAEAAGQLGIATEDIMSFTRVMIDLGNSTVLSAEEAATSLAKFANVTKMSAKNYSNLGSTIVALGNNFATNEAAIVEMATRLASTGELAGLTAAEILALATAMSSVGIEAEAGGSAMSKLLKTIQVAAETGSDDLKDFAKIANMSTKEFKETVEKDAIGALTAFITGLNDTERNGKSAILILEEMGLTEVRLSNTILSLANASGVMNDAVELANEAWEDNTALTEEANKRYANLKSKITMALSKVKDIAITLGEKLMPSIEKIIDKVGEWTEKISKLDEEQVDAIIKIGMVVAAAGPVITIMGKITTVVGGTTKTISFLVESFKTATGVITSTKASVNLLANGLKFLGSSAGIFATGGFTSLGLMLTGTKMATEELEKDLKTMSQSANEFVSGISNAESHLSSFNSTLFASNEEQIELQNNMQEVQTGITAICKRAAEERRGYTQEEITQLDEYFQKLRELKNKELEIQKSIANAISQQAIQNAEAFNGSLEEYKTVSQEWIKTAQEQADKEIQIINEQTTQEIALLQQRYGDKATLQNEEYAKEYQKVIENKDKNIAAVNEELAKVNTAFLKGYEERAAINEKAYAILSEYNSKYETEQKRHEDRVNEIKQGGHLMGMSVIQATQVEQSKHTTALKHIWNEMYKNMSDSEIQQLGVWLGLVTQTELYGGQVEEETQNMVDTILDSYNSMPKNAKTTMKDTMQGMLEGMKEKEPSLFSRATSIATNVISRLNKAFDVHSPSRKTRKTSRNVMEGLELGVEDKAKDVYSAYDEVADNVMDRLDGISADNLELETSGTVINSNYKGINSNSNGVLGQIDYNQMANAMLRALTGCRFSLDDEGFARIVDDRLREVL